MFLVPFPPRLSDEERAEVNEVDCSVLRHISEMRDFSSKEIDRYFDAAHRIGEYEERRKTSAETRAATYLAAIAALIPLMTWALGNSTPICRSAVGCGVWSAIFDIAVAYFLFSAWWCLRTLSVANYHVFGVEDLVAIKDAGRPIERELIVQELLQSRKNRNTINAKLDYLRTAQRCFFLGLLLIGGLLAVDPWFRFVPSAPGDAKIDLQKSTQTPDRDAVSTRQLSGVQHTPSMPSSPTSPVGPIKK